MSHDLILVGIKTPLPIQNLKTTDL